MASSRAESFSAIGLCSYVASTRRLRATTARGHPPDGRATMGEGLRDAEPVRPSGRSDRSDEEKERRRLPYRDARRDSIRMACSARTTKECSFCRRCCGKMSHSFAWRKERCLRRRIPSVPRELPSAGTHALQGRRWRRSRPAVSSAFEPQSLRWAKDLPAAAAKPHRKTRCTQRLTQ